MWFCSILPLDSFYLFPPAKSLSAPIFQCSKSDSFRQPITKMQNEPTNCRKSRTPTGPLPNGRGSDNVTKAFVEIVAILLLLLLPGRPRKYKTNPPTATNHVLRLDRSLTVAVRIT